MGRPRTERSQRAVDLGFKLRDGAETARDYLAALKPTMNACELLFPPLAEIELDSSSCILQ